jgi:hypothetical protein
LLQLSFLGAVFCFCSFQYLVNKKAVKAWSFKLHNLWALFRALSRSHISLSRNSNEWWPINSDCDVKLISHHILSTNNISVVNSHMTFPSAQKWESIPKQACSATTCLWWPI